MFEPRQITGPSGLANSPRPYVFRASHLDGQTIESGQIFHFDMHWFGLNLLVRDPVTHTFAQLAEEGLGPSRAKVELLAEEGSGLITLPLKSGGSEVTRITVRFVTPTELKGEGGLVDRPEFGVLAARARDRISLLCQLYGEGELNLDYRGFGHRANLVRMGRCDVQSVNASRRSSRTGQVHPLGGFTGEAEYEGDLAEFMPWLRAAEWTGVGRQTVWGKGVILTRDHIGSGAKD